MFSDPQSVTINAVAQSLPRVSVGSNTSTYTKDDGLVSLSVSHKVSGKRTRRVIRLDHAKIAADPLLAGVNVKATTAFYLVADIPETGYTVTEQKQIGDALVAYLSASSGANLTKILGGES